MQISDTLMYHQHLHTRSSVFCRQHLDADQVAYRLKPLVAKSVVGSNNQLSLQYDLGAAYQRTLTDAEKSPDNQTLGLFAYQVI